MKILYVDVNGLYINPTNEQLKYTIMFNNDVQFYGPGYSSHEVLKQGIINFINNNSFDLVLFGGHAMSIAEPNKEKIKRFYKKYIFTSEKFEIIYDFLYDIYKNITKINIKKILSLQSFDYYACDKDTIKRLIDIDGYYIAYGKQFVANIDALPNHFKDEVFYKRKSKTNKITNNWYEFANTHDSKIISITHLVAMNEFFFDPLEIRKYTVWVPGIKYKLRENAFNEISSYDFKTPSELYYKIYKVLNKLNFNMYSYYLSLISFNLFYRKNLFQTRYAYVAGSGYNSPIRKVFEVPAAGNLVLAKPTLGFEELGFINGENYIYCEPEDIKSKVLYFEKNLDEAQHIAQKAQNLILKQHSIDARMQQLQNSFNSILNSKFNGTEWVNGDFIINEK